MATQARSIRRQKGGAESTGRSMQHVVARHHLLGREMPRANCVSAYVSPTSCSRHPRHRRTVARGGRLATQFTSAAAPRQSATTCEPFPSWPPVFYHLCLPPLPTLRAQPSGVLAAMRQTFTGRASSPQDRTGSLCKLYRNVRVVR